MNNYLTRESVISKAVDGCYKELYKRAQPSANFEDLVEQYKVDKQPFYDRYYVSSEELKYVVEKYIKAYGLEDPWERYFDLLIDNLKNGGTKDKWIPDRIDEDGFKHPGYRGYEKYNSLHKQFSKILNNYFLSEFSINELTDTLTDKVFELIDTVKNFYRHSRERNDFTYTMYLGSSPTSNPKSVIDYWKSKGVDIVIEERNPLLFWDQDYYGEGFEEVMIDEYGENWKEIKDKEWKLQKEKEEKEREEKLKQYEKRTSEQLS